ncbi:MAG: class I SAM-dependent methyltransferase [Phenylobacterium sp.]|uniref:class I SAM-dependent methyltransferase n=1 Tax=Phenylobacterium sp. TaxID=1871053 RepID=UPI00122A915A|nr:class I SAM-dependent methyltransferase [Phenylobacterium sp.]TAJ71365.1 MAG: class I SAM-dependent methyltransferase [Phenylobacterium sp.]
MSLPHLMTLDPPYELGDEAATFTFGGWTEVDDEDAPNVTLTINGRPAPVQVYPRPQVRNHFPGIQVRGVIATVDFADLLAGIDLQQARGGFLIEAELGSDHRSRVFEYAVSPGWMRRVFGDGPRARAVPPAHLQIRVAGAAAGEYNRTGEAAAKRLEALADAAGFSLARGQNVLDFGCGPGRLISALAPRHPSVRFHGADIDAEAIAWAQAALADFGAFTVNPHLPPLPYADEVFDLIFSLSTFTHMPEDHQFAWLDELRRVLKPGALLVTTIMNPFAYDLPAKIMEQAADTGFAYWDDAAETEGLPSFYRLAYHTHDYVRRHWARGFEVLAIGGHDLNDTQDSVLLRRV